MGFLEKYKELVKIMETKISVETVQGLDIIIKQIPDTDIEGGYDPRVLEVRKKEWENNSEFGHGAGIEEIRATMGWPNIDVTDGTITTKERTIQGRNGDIPIRVYVPSGNKIRPCMVFFHGGGFFGGSLGCVENPCKCIADNADAVVVSADYRLAPEHPFPQGFDDNYDVVTWIYNHSLEFGINKEQIGVCGDSAGANMAAVCTLKDHNNGTNMIKFEALLYPTLDMGMLQHGYTWEESQYNMKENAEMVTASIHALGKNSEMLIDLYLQGNKEECRNPYVSPLFAEDVSNIPATIIINAEYDYLRLEGEAYGRKLQNAGVPVTMIRYNGTDHAFMDKIGEYPQAEDAMKEVAKGFLKAVK